MLRRIKRVLAWGRDRIEDRWLALHSPPIALPEAIARQRVLLVGASVGKAWQLHVLFPNIRTLDHYEFDKTPAVERAIARRPDAIIIKECAAYFPDDGIDRELIGKWLARIRGAGIRAVLATVVPVTRTHAAGVPGRAEAIWAFNDWVREVAGAERLPLLDLEAALRRSSDDRYLDERFAAPDGLHLVAPAYRHRLDPLIAPLLARTFC